MNETPKQRPPRKEKLPAGMRRRGATLQISYYDANRIRRWETVPSGRVADAKLLRAQRLAQVAAGNYAAPSQTSLADYLEAWFESRRDRLASYTLERYRTLARIQVSPRIGRVSLTKLTGATLAALYADLAREGGKNGGPLSSTTCRQVHSMLHAALSAACRQRLLALNPADHVEPPRARKGTMHFLEPTDLARLLAGTAARPDLRRLYVPALLGGVLGLRRGEALACRWADLSFEIGELLVARSLEAIRTPQPGSGTASRSLSFKTPKSGRARRVAVPRFVLDALAKHRVEQAKARLALGPGYADHDLIVCWPDGRPWHPESFTPAFRTAARSLGFPGVSYHTLRHTAISTLIATGTHAKVVQEVAGHHSASFTLDRYGHLAATLQREAADRLDTLFGGLGKDEGTARTAG